MTGQGVTLQVGGAIYAPWESITIDRSIEAVAGRFELSVTDTPDNQAVMAIAPQSPCQLMVGGVNVVSGFVDSVGPETDADSHSIVVRGRDATGDLVDCAYADGKMQMLGNSYLQVITQLVAKFALPIRVGAGVNTSMKFTDFSVQPGETVWEAIDRASRFAGVLPISDGNGGIMLTQAGQSGANTQLQVGVNCERESFLRDDSGRFSKYIILGNGVPSTLDMAYVPANCEGIAYDTGVSRYRPRIIVGEFNSFNKQDYVNRALWEAAVRYGRAFRGVYAVNSWVDAAGALWQPNGMVEVIDPLADIDDQLLIAGVKFTLDGEGGTRAALTVTRREAFLTQPLAPYPAFQSTGGAYAVPAPQVPSNIVPQ